jgi:23S rRNA pseudouridine2605 synthase
VRRTKNAIFCAKGGLPLPAERLQKIIAAAGIASRRKAEELITGGLVSVNGKTVTELGTKADPEVDRIKVNGKVLSGPERHVYLLLHKPKGYVTTVTDPEGRPTVLDLVRGIGSRVYPIGRLDYLSEGLLLLTNDGELAQKLTHASSHVSKTYLVKVAGKPDEQQLDKLRTGIKLPAERSPLKAPAGAEGKRESRRRSEAVHTAPSRIKLLREAANPWYEVTLVEGRNRQIRRMFEEIGHHVEKIKRVEYGPLQLDVEAGKFRHLTSKEVGQLQGAVRGKKRVKE